MMSKEVSKKTTRKIKATHKRTSKKKTSKTKTSRKRSSTKKRLKSGLMQPFEVCGQRLDELTKTYELSVSGIGLIKTRPDALRKLKKYVDEDFSKNQVADWSKLDKISLDSHLDKMAKTGEVYLNLREAEQEAVQAKDLLSKGLLLIHYQTLVLLWSILESFVHILISNILLYDQKIKENDKIRKITIPLGYFEDLDAQERSYFIIRELEHQFAASQRKGIGRFESLLNIFGLGGGLKETYRRDLLELQQIRHVIIHRRGIVDRKLSTACPWLKLKISSEININRIGLKKYFKAVTEYTLEISKRMIKKYSKSKIKKKAKTLSKNI